MPSHLAELIIRQTQASIVTTVSRTVDRIADSLAEELLRDPVIRSELQVLVRAAFHQAWLDLQAPVPPPPSAP